MTADPTSRPPRTPRARRLRRALLLLFVLAVLLAALPGLWMPALIAGAGPWAAERFGGLVLTIDEVVSAGWSSVELRGLHLRAPGDDPWLDLSAERVAAGFDLLALADDPLDAVASLEADRPRLRLAPPPTKSGAPEDPEAGSASGFAWPTALPRVDIEDGRVELIGLRSEPLALEGFDLTALGGRAVALDFDVLRAPGLLPEDELRAGALRADYEAGGWTDVSLAVEGEPLITGGRADLAPLADGSLEFGGRLSYGGATATADARMDDAQWSGDVRAEDLPLAWAQPFLPEEMAIAGYVDLEGTWSLPTNDIDAGTATAELQARDVSVFGAPGVDVSGAARWEEGAISSERLSLVQGENGVEVTDLRWRPGAEGWTGIALALEVEARDVPALARLAGAEPPDEDPPPHDLRLGARLADGELAVQRGRLDTVGGRIEIRAGVVRAKPTADAPTRVALYADFDDLSQLGRLVGGEWSGALDGELSFEDAGAGPELRGSVHGSLIAIDGHELGEVRLVGVVDPPNIVVSELESDGPAGLVRGSGVYDWEDRRLRQVALELALDDISRLVPDLPVRGAAEGEATLDGPLEALDGSVLLEARELTIGNRSVAEANVRAVLDGGDVLLEQLVLVDGDTRVELAGDLEFGADRTLLAAALTDARLVAGDAELSLEEATRIRLEGARVALEELRLSGTAGTLELSGVWGADERHARIAANELQVSRFLAGHFDLPLDLGVLDGFARVALDGDRVDAEADLGLRGLARGDARPPVDVVLRARHADGRLRVEQFDVDAESGPLLRMSAEAPLTPLQDDPIPDGPLRVALETGDGLVKWLATAAGAQEPSGTLSISMNLEGSVSEPRGSVRLAAHELGWRLREGRPPLGPATADVALALEPGLLRVDNGQIALDGTETLSLEGELRGPTDLRRWIGSTADAADETRLDLALATTRLDWQRVRSQLERIDIPTGPVRTGVLDLRVAVSGMAADPRVTGSATLEEASARLGTLPSIAGVSAALSFEGGRLELERFEGELGGAPFVLSGTIVMGESGPVFDARLKGERLLLVRSGGTRVRANVDATVTGPLDSLLVAGRADISEGIYSTPIDITGFLGGPQPVRARGIQIFRIEEEPMSNARFDLEIGTQSGANFLIATSAYKGGLRPDLHLGGTGALPVLTGTIYFDPAEVNLPATRLRVTSGTLVFDESNPFVPTLNLRAEGRMRGYDVIVSVSGPFDDTQVTMSSDPPLTQTDLLNLVLTGRTPGDDTTHAGDVAQQLATYLAKDLIAHWFAPEPGDQSGDSLMDRIQIITGEDVSRTGQTTIEGRFRIAENVLRENDALYVTGERDAFDFYNFGFRISFRIR